MDSQRARTQNIRFLKILVVNLMPKKANTEVQLLRHLANTPLQLEVEFLYMASHKSKNTSNEYLENYYRTFAYIKDKRYDIVGWLLLAPRLVEQLPFQEVDYWSELCQLMEWSKTYVYSRLHLCWGAQAGLYYHFGIDKQPLEKKLSGIYEQEVVGTSPLLRGFDDSYRCPHSRYTTIYPDQLKKCSLQILAEGSEVGVAIAASDDLRQIYSFGHLEYSRDTLSEDTIETLMPVSIRFCRLNYFPDDDPEKKPRLTWSLAASTFFSNWINYAVYQETPYDLAELD